MSQQTLERQLDTESPSRASAYSYGTRRETATWPSVQPAPTIQSKPKVTVKTTVRSTRRRRPSLVQQVCQFTLVMGVLYGLGAGATTLMGSVMLRVAQHRSESSAKSAESFTKAATRMNDHITEAQRQFNLEKWAQMDQLVKAHPSEIVAGVVAPAAPSTRVASLATEVPQSSVGNSGVQVDVKVSRVGAGQP